MQHLEKKEGDDRIKVHPRTDRETDISVCQGLEREKDAAGSPADIESQAGKKKTIQQDFFSPVRQRMQKINNSNLLFLQKATLAGKKKLGGGQWEKSVERYGINAECRKIQKTTREGIAMGDLVSLPSHLTRGKRAKGNEVQGTDLPKDEVGGAAHWASEREI